MRRTKPRTMWLSKFSSLSRRSKPIALGSLHEAFPDVALVRLRCLDAVPHMHGLAVATAHVLVDLFSMSQAIGQHGVYIREAQRVVRLYDRLGSSATTKSMYHDLKQDPRFAYAIDSWRIFSERNRHGLDRGHVGARRRCHDGTIIAVRHRVRKPPTIVTARGAIDGRRAIYPSNGSTMSIVRYGLSGGRPACHLRHSPRPLRPPSGCSHPCNVAGERSVARGVTAKDGARPAVFWSTRRTLQSARDTCRFGNDLLYSAHA